MAFSIQNSDFSTRIASLYGSQPSSVVFAYKTATLAPELQVSMGLSPHLWFLHSKQRLYHQNCKSLRVPALICAFCLQNNDFWVRITSLYGSQTTAVVLRMPNNVISIRITSLCGSQPSSVVLECKTASFGSELQVSMGPRLRLLICERKTACLDPE